MTYEEYKKQAYAAYSEACASQRKAYYEACASREKTYYEAIAWHAKAYNEAIKDFKSKEAERSKENQDKLVLDTYTRVNEQSLRDILRTFEEAFL